MTPYAENTTRAGFLPHAGVMDVFNNVTQGALVRSEVRETKIGERGMVVIEVRQGRESKRVVLWGTPEAATKGAALLAAAKDDDTVLVDVLGDLGQRQDYSLRVEVLDLRPKRA